MLSIISRIRSHLKDSNSSHRRIFYSFLWVGILVFASRFLGLTKEIVLASRYGITAKLDAYILIFNITNLPIGIIFIVLSMVLLPLITVKDDTSIIQVTRFRSEIFGLTILFCITIAVAAYIGIPLLFNTRLIGFTGAALENSRRIVAPLTMLIPIGILCSFFSTWLMAVGYHWNTLLEGVPALVILIFLLLPEGFISDPLTYGTVAGFILQLLCLIYILYTSKNLGRPIFTLRSISWSIFWNGFVTVGIAQTLLTLTLLIDQIIATHLGVGAVSALSFANRVVSILVSLGTLAIGRALLPIFSELATNNKFSLLINLAKFWAKLILIGGFAIVLLIWFFVPYIVKILFERGAFKINSTVLVSSIVRVMLFQIPFSFSAIVFQSVYASIKRYNIIIKCSLASVLAKIITITLFVKYFGIQGIAYSTDFMYIIFLLSYGVFIISEH